MGKTPELNKRIIYGKKRNSTTLKTEGSEEEQKPYLITNQQQQSKFTKNSSFIKSINISHHLPTEEKIVSKKTSMMLPLEVSIFF